MKNKRAHFGIYLPVFLLMTVLVTALRTVACFLDFNFETHFFDSKIIIGISDWLVVGSVVFFLSYIFTSKKDRKLIPNFTTPATYVPTGLVSASLLFLSIQMFREFASLRKQTTGFFEGAVNSKIVIEVLAIACAVMSLLSIVHFIYTALDERERSKNRANFGLFTILLLSAYSVFLYFTKELPINAPTKIVDQMAYLFASVFFLYETRLSLGRERWREYISFGFISAMLTAYSSIPTIILYIAEGKLLSHSIYESALALSLFIFITARILLTGELIEDKPSPLAESLISAANSRNAELLAKETPDAEISNADDGVEQLSFDDFSENGFEKSDEAEDGQIKEAPTDNATQEAEN